MLVDSHIPKSKKSAHLTIVTISPLNAKQIATMDNSRIKLRRTNKIEDLLRTDMLNLSMMRHCLGVGYEGLREDLRLREKTKGTNGGGRPALAKERENKDRGEGNLGETDKSVQTAASLEQGKIREPLFERRRVRASNRTRSSSRTVTPSGL